MHTRALATLAVLAGVVACQPGPGTTPSAEGDATAGPADAPLLRYACNDGFAFGADLLAADGAAELAATPEAAALRDFLGRGDMDIAWLPDAGWILAGADARHAQFLAPDAQGGSMVDVTLESTGGAWEVTGWGGCQPQRVLAGGLGEASWVLAPDEQIGPATIAFTALVTERDCASGRSSEGRVVGPEILQLEDEVLVTFAIRPIPALTQTCQGNPPTMVEVVMPGPLGARRLLDGGTLPPREPVAEP